MNAWPGNCANEDLFQYCEDAPLRTQGRLQSLNERPCDLCGLEVLTGICSEPYPLSGQITDKTALFHPQLRWRIKIYKSQVCIWIEEFVRNGKDYGKSGIPTDRTRYGPSEKATSRDGGVVG